MCVTAPTLTLPLGKDTRYALWCNLETYVEGPLHLSEQVMKYSEVLYCIYIHTYKHLFNEKMELSACCAGMVQLCEESTAATRVPHVLCKFSIVGWGVGYIVTTSSYQIGH